MLEFRTQGFNPYAVKYSPYYDSRIAVASSANYGIVGNGRLYSLGLTAQGVQVEKVYGLWHSFRTLGVELMVGSQVRHKRLVIRPRLVGNQRKPSHCRLRRWLPQAL